MKKNDILVYNFSTLFTRVGNQFIIDPDGNIHKLIDLDFYSCVFYEVDSIYYEICKYIEPNSDDPEYLLSLKGWIFVDLFQMQAKIKLKPTNNQCITLFNLGIYEVYTDGGFVFKFKVK